MTPAMRDAPDATIVTGAGGWLGSALMEALTEDTSRWTRAGTIRALVTNRAEAARLADLSHTVQPFVGDVTDSTSLEPLFAGLTGAVDVIHTAGVIHPRRTTDFDRINAGGTATMVDLAHKHDVRRFVHVSSNSPFGTNSHPGDHFRNEEPYHPYYGYGQSKMDAELAVLDAVVQGLDAVIVRPPWFYGPHQPPRQTTFFKLVRTGRFPVIGRGDQMRSMVYVDNLVDGVMHAELVPTPPGRGWWIADARPYAVREIVETVGRALTAEGFDVAPNRVRMPGITSRIAEVADGLIQRRGRYHQQLHVLGEMGNTIACDISVAQAELGYEPSVALEEGMRRSIRWCVAQGIEL
jgi:nucleoside-diphosphate-sugar epimerase